jgi:hypothetical protein
VVSTKRRVALHMKPGCGPTIEGLLVKYHRRGRRPAHEASTSHLLIDAEMLEDADRTHSIAGPVFVHRENVYCRQAI